jgi:hypothetical protein
VKLAAKQTAHRGCRELQRLMVSFRLPGSRFNAGLEDKKLNSSRTLRNAPSFYLFHMVEVMVPDMVACDERLPVAIFREGDEQSRDLANQRTDSLSASS